MVFFCVKKSSKKFNKLTYIKILSIIKIDREDMKMKQEFDLHMHTSYSDGEHPLEIVLKKIKENELKIFSITDHDLSLIHI